MFKNILLFVEMLFFIIKKTFNRESPPLLRERGLGGEVMRGTCFVILIALSSCASTTEITKTPKVIFFIVDGIPGDVIEKLNPPTLQEIAGENGFTRAYVGGERDGYSESPTISAVGYNSLITGTWANKHNVWDNDIAEPNYNYWGIFRLAKMANPALKTAVFSSWLDNRTKLVGDSLPATGNIAVDFKFDGLENDTIQYPHDNGKKYMQRIDSAVTEEAARVVLNNAPDLSWVYMEFTDDMGHRHGDSKIFYDAIMEADKQINKVWQSVKTRSEKFNEDWLVVITTDHGRDAKTGKDHGGQSERERSTWIVTNAKNLNERFKQTPTVVDIYPTMAQHLNLSIPESVANELDGISFTGPIDISNLNATSSGNAFTLTWKAHTTGSAQVLISTSNKFKNGGADKYEKVADISLADESYSFEPKSKSDFYKIVLVTKNQRINRWIQQTK